MLIDETLDILSERITEYIIIEKKYDNKLPKILDFGLSCVLTNIIKNGLDAILGQGKLEIATQTNSGHLEIRVKDSGIGIPPESANRIFEPFFSTKASNEGTGLGLSICDEIIKKYGGRIKVDSQPGKGSTFAILIPAKFLQNA
jgi:two-component system NtrC family sensor kinase